MKENEKNKKKKKKRKETEWKECWSILKLKNNLNDKLVSFFFENDKLVS